MPQHAELCWLLNTVTPMGWMEKMIQYKEKAKKQVRSLGPESVAGEIEREMMGQSMCKQERSRGG